MMQTFSVRRAAAVSSAVLSFLVTLLRFFERLLQATGPTVVLPTSVNTKML